MQINTLYLDLFLVIMSR